MSVIASEVRGNIHFLFLQSGHIAGRHDKLSDANWFGERGGTESNSSPSPFKRLSELIWTRRPWCAEPRVEGEAEGNIWTRPASMEFPLRDRRTNSRDLWMGRNVSGVDASLLPGVGSWSTQVSQALAFFWPISLHWTQWRLCESWWCELHIFFLMHTSKATIH